MKKIVITLFSVAAATTMYGQGNFNFNDLNSTAQITISSNNAGASEGAKGNFVGTGYTASLYYGAASSTQFSQLTLFPGADAIFFGGAASEADQLNGAGFFDGGNTTLPFPAGIEVAVAVWWNGNGATSYASALASGYNTGVSALVPITLTTSADPSTIQDLAALQSFTVGVVPEPTTLALCGLGAASLLLFRRKK